MKLSDRGIGLIAHFEGKRLTAYHDAVGVLTIGYGHTSRAGMPIVTDGMTITDAQALDILRTDAAKFESAVSRVLTRAPNQNQFDAMVSLCYNIGPGNFGSSTVLADFNAGNTEGAAAAFERWNKAGGQVLAGLSTRRAAEEVIFRAPMAPVVAGVEVVPSVIVPTKPLPVQPVGPLQAFIRLIAFILSILLKRKT